MKPKDRWSQLVVVAFSLGNVSAGASPNVCDQPEERSELAIAAANQDGTALEPPPGMTTQRYRDFSVLVRPALQGLAFGAGHRYVIFNFDGIEPQTNGHLHTSFFPLHWVNGDDRGSFRISVAPTLSASSNVMGHPQTYRGETLQVLAALAWRKRLSESTTLRYGLCADHRFGDYRVYPSIGAEWQLHRDWLLDLGLPVTRLQWRFSSRWNTAISLAPDGNEWHVMDRDLAGRSQFVFEAYAVDWQVAWQVSPHLEVSAGAGTQFESRHEMTLSGGERVRRRSDPALRLDAGLRWRF